MDFSVIGVRDRVPGGACWSGILVAERDGHECGPAAAPGERPVPLSAVRAGGRDGDGQAAASLQTLTCAIPVRVVMPRPALAKGWRVLYVP